MPFGPYDLHGEVYDQFCEAQIAVIVLLASDEECLHKTGCNLRRCFKSVDLLPSLSGEDMPHDGGTR
jgi:hypothetical protein